MSRMTSLLGITVLVAVLSGSAEGSADPLAEFFQSADLRLLGYSAWLVNTGNQTGVDEENLPTDHEHPAAELLMIREPEMSLRTFLLVEALATRYPTEHVGGLSFTDAPQNPQKHVRLMPVTWQGENSLVLVVRMGAASESDKELAQQKLHDRINEIAPAFSMYGGPLLVQRLREGEAYRLDAGSEQDLRRILERASSEEQGRIGIAVSFERDGIHVTGLVKDGPAAKAGIEDGDVISSVDAKPVAGIEPRQALDLLRGQAGTAVNLTILRDGRPVDFVVVRDREPTSTESITKYLDKDEFPSQRMQPTD